MNKVILCGNLGADPETRDLPKGGSVVTLSLATSKKWKDKASGQVKEDTQWHRVVLYEPLTNVAQYLHKGSKALVEGEIRYRKWDDKEGVTRYTTEIVARGLELLNRVEGGAGGQPQQQAGNKADSQQQAGADFEDDIPF